VRVDYAIALFLHVLGAIALFIGLALELAISARMRAATTVGQVREALWYGGIIQRIMSLAPLVIFLAGLYLMVTVWGASYAWLDVSLVIFVVLTVLGATVNARHFLVLGQAASSAPDGAVPEALRARIVDPAASAVLLVMTALGISIVFMMTTKPSLIPSLIAVGVALVIGLAVGQLLGRPAGAAAGGAAPGKPMGR
jgi:hypothetical protein